MTRGDISVKVKLQEEVDMYVNNRGILEKITALLDSIDLYEEIDISITREKVMHSFTVSADDNMHTMQSSLSNYDTITTTAMDGIRQTFKPLDIE